MLHTVHLLSDTILCEHTKQHTYCQRMSSLKMHKPQLLYPCMPTPRTAHLLLDTALCQHFTEFICCLILHYVNTPHSISAVYVCIEGRLAQTGWKIRSPKTIILSLSLCDMALPPVTSNLLPPPLPSTTSF